MKIKWVHFTKIVQRQLLGVLIFNHLALTRQCLTPLVMFNRRLFSHWQSWIRNQNTCYMYSVYVHLS